MTFLVLAQHPIICAMWRRLCILACLLPVEMIMNFQEFASFSIDCPDLVNLSRGKGNPILFR